MIAPPARRAPRCLTDRTRRAERTSPIAEHAALGPIRPNAPHRETGRLACTPDRPHALRLAATAAASARRGPAARRARPRPAPPGRCAPSRFDAEGTHSAPGHHRGLAQQGRGGPPTAHRRRIARHLGDNPDAHSAVGHGSPPMFSCWAKERQSWHPEERRMSAAFCDAGAELPVCIWTPRGADPQLASWPSDKSSQNAANSSRLRRLRARSSGPRPGPGERVRVEGTVPRAAAGRRLGDLLLRRRMLLPAASGSPCADGLEGELRPESRPHPRPPAAACATSGASLVAVRLVVALGPLQQCCRGRRSPRRPPRP
jgi:hypothetical protein